MGFDFVVLGATGMQGRIVSRDLLEKKYSVLLCGRDKPRVEHFLRKFRKSNFSFFDARNIDMIYDIVLKSGSKVVINCVEGDYNLNILKACVKARANCIDLGSEIWMTKKQFALDDDLKKRDIISITGCGSVPGIGNVMLRYAADKFDKIDTIEVGFSWDSNIKKFVKKIPLSSIIENYHRKIGKQKEFYVRHPETYTFYKYYKNKGIKNIRFYAGFPEHSFDAIITLIELG